MQLGFSVFQPQEVAKESCAAGRDPKTSFSKKWGTTNLQGRAATKKSYFLWFGLGKILYNPNTKSIFTQNVVYSGYCSFTGKIYSCILYLYIHSPLVIPTFAFLCGYKKEKIMTFFQGYFLLEKKLPLSQGCSSTSTVSSGEFSTLTPSSNSRACH